jgi:hypothetical protein
LAIDRTNWQRGETDVNLLTLAVVVGKTAVALFWCDLAHPGNSDTAPRIALIQEFLTLFGSPCIRLITADREFIGADWRVPPGCWLHQQNLPFLIRIRKDDLLRSAHPCRRDQARTFTSKNLFVSYSGGRPPMWLSRTSFKKAASPGGFSHASLSVTYRVVISFQACRPKQIIKQPRLGPGIREGEGSPVLCERLLSVP